MNQQEIDRLFDQHMETRLDCVDYAVMTRDDFAQASAEIRRQAFLEAAQVAKARAEHASSAALKLHGEKKLTERDKTVFRALYLHFTSLANELENMSVGAHAQSEQEKSC